MTAKQASSGNAPANVSAHMEQIFSRDMDDSRHRFGAWLVERLAGKADVTLLNFDRPQASGLSHELISADVAWFEGGQPHGRPLMIRLDPVRYRKRQTSNLRREFDTLSALAAHSDLPVPPALWYETDTSILGAEFYVMERLEGLVMGDPPYRRQGWFFDLTPEARGRAIDNAIRTMASIHLLPPAILGFLRREDDRESDLDQHLKYWHSSYRWATAAQPNPVADRGWEWLLRNRPADYPTGIAWGDAHPRNLMFRELECTAIFDWEDVSLSSPLADLGRWFMTDRLMAAAGFPLLEGVPTREETTARWEQVTGFSARNLRWFEMLSVCGGAGALARTIQVQRELFGEPQSVESKFLPSLNAVIEDLLTSRTTDTKA